MSKPAYVWDGSQWVAIGAPIPESPISYQSSAPASPTTGDIWVDSDDDTLRIYNGSTWNLADGLTDDFIDPYFLMGA